MRNTSTVTTLLRHARGRPGPRSGGADVEGPSALPALVANRPPGVRTRNDPAGARSLSVERSTTPTVMTTSTERQAAGWPHSRPWGAPRCPPCPCAGRLRTRRPRLGRHHPGQVQSRDPSHAGGGRREDRTGTGAAADEL